MSRKDKKNNPKIEGGATMGDITETGSETAIEEPVTEETTAPVQETSPVAESNIIDAIIEAVTEGTTVEDFKTRLALSGLMKDTDDLQIGRLGKTGVFHLAILNQRDSVNTCKVMVGGQVVPMAKNDFDNYYMSGTYIGADLILYNNADSMILLKGAIIIKIDGTIVLI